MELNASTQTGLSLRILNDIVSMVKGVPQVERAVIFGSRAQGNFHSGSDIDLAVYAPAMSSRDFANLWSKIDDLPIAFPMDVLHYDEIADEALKASIDRDQIPLLP